jgi:hypothetical protein
VVPSGLRKKIVGKNDCSNPKDQKFQNPQNSRRFVHMIVMGSAFLLLEIRWQNGWQADQMHTLSAHLFTCSI